MKKKAVTAAISIGKALNCYLSSCRYTVFELCASAEDDESSHCADDDCIYEYFEYSEKSLLYRVVYVCTCMCHRSRSETCFIGEDTSCNTFLYAEEHASDYTACYTCRTECTFEDGDDSSRNISEVDYDNSDSEENVEYSHERNELLCYCSDSLNTADKDESDENSEDYSYDEIECPDSAFTHDVE